MLVCALGGHIYKYLLYIDTCFKYHLIVNSKHLKILKFVFEIPVRANIEWKDIESLLVALGASKEEGNGSRVRFILNGVFATFHRPHPEKEADRGAVTSVKRFLMNAGVKPC